MLRIAVFASGGGSNLQALIDHFNAAKSTVATVALVLSDRAHAGALERARQAGIPQRVIEAEGRAPGAAAHEILATLESERIDIIALAGYLRLVPAAIVEPYRDRIVNIHPALLPAFGGQGMYGMRVHRAVLEAGCFVTGVSVHYVDENYDEGRPLAQWPVPVLRGDTPETLAARVLRAEHVIYPVAIEKLARRILAARAAGVPDTITPGFAAPHTCAFVMSADGSAGIAAGLSRMLGSDVEGT